ncbi:MAG: hypothetical protein MZU91_13240 [Desulfosudis oleivorans]|nr:hypothetical protein [Desulfosudis oleivorans]
MDYPICGNFWSDHSSSDQFNGISQDVVGADGISDSPCSNILGTAGSIDRYPLLHKGMNGADVPRLHHRCSVSTYAPRTLH